MVLYYYNIVYIYIYIEREREREGERLRPRRNTYYTNVVTSGKRPRKEHW